MRRNQSHAHRETTVTAPVLDYTCRSRREPSHTAGNRRLNRPGREMLLLPENCYDDLCFGVFPLRVEIRPSAAGGTCVS